MLIPVLRALPFLLLPVVALFPRGVALRAGGVGVALVALATAAASRVPEGTAPFRLINGALFWGGIILVGIGALVSWHRRTRSAAMQRDVVPPAPAISPSWFQRFGMPALLVLLLVPALVLLLTIAGSEGMSLQGLRDAPLSSAAEVLLAALVLPATLVLAGTWPFGALARGPRLAPLGAALLLIVVLPLLGDGLVHWRSVYAGWLVLAALIAAARADGPGLMSCGGLFALSCGEGPARWAGALLVTIAAGCSMAAAMSSVARRVVYVAAALCGLVALGGTLQVEVFFSVAMVLAAIVAILRSPVPAEDGA